MSIEVMGKSDPEDVDNVVLNVKEGTRPGLKPDGSAAYMRESVKNCLKMLGLRGKIDMFEPARRDPSVPLKEAIPALAELVKEGKIGGVALSEVNANTIRETSNITKIVAMEIELSLRCTYALKNGIVKTWSDLDIPIIASSPLGRGVLSNKIKSISDVPVGDVRRMLPRFNEDNFTTNFKLVEALLEMANKNSCTPGQLAISWGRTSSRKHGNPAIFPIPGSANVKSDRECGGRGVEPGAYEGN